jgi:demethylmenaquinone methyltransferase/2-methoxy-6-polyprenyl-1,4-benzoquinol methylase
MGQNGRWRRAMVDHIVPDRPGVILDVASGPAGVALQLAERSQARVVGVDLTLEMLRQGRRNIAQRSMTDRVQLVAGRAEQTPFADATFDALTFTYLLRYVDDPQATLVELARVVKPGGPVASLEFLLPRSRFWRFWWWGYTRILLPAAGWVTGGRAWFDVGRFLGPNIAAHYRRYPVDWTVEAWQKAGFVDVGVRRMSLGGGLVMWGRRASG